MATMFSMRSVNCPSACTSLTTFIATAGEVAMPIAATMLAISLPTPNRVSTSNSARKVPTLMTMPVSSRRFSRSSQR